MAVMAAARPPLVSAIRGRQRCLHVAAQASARRRPGRSPRLVSGDEDAGPQKGAEALDAAAAEGADGAAQHSQGATSSAGPPVKPARMPVKEATTMASC